MPLSNLELGYYNPTNRYLWVMSHTGSERGYNPYTGKVEYTYPNLNEIFLDTYTGTPVRANNLVRVTEDPNTVERVKSLPGVEVVATKKLTPYDIFLGENRVNNVRKAYKTNPEIITAFNEGLNLAGLSALAIASPELALKLGINPTLAKFLGSATLTGLAGYAGLTGLEEYLEGYRISEKKKNKSKKPKNTASEESSSSQAEASAEAPVSEANTEASTESATPQPLNDSIPNTNLQGKLSRLLRTRKWLGNKIAGDQTPKQPKSPKTSKEFGIQDFLYRTSKNTPNWPTWGRQLWNIGVGIGAVSALHAGREYVIPYAGGVFTGNYPDNKSESKIVEEVKPPLKKDLNQVADSIDNVKKQLLLDMYRKQ